MRAFDAILLTDTVIVFTLLFSVFFKMITLDNYVTYAIYSQIFMLPALAICPMRVKVIEKTK
jgi:hypothetical protein